MARARLPTSVARDPLGEVLHLLRLTGVLYCQARLTAPWGIDIPDLDGCLSFQICTAGRYLLEVQGVEPRWIERGGIALVPHGRPHRARSHRRVRAVPLAELPVVAMTPYYEHLTLEGTGETTQITHGTLRFDRVAAHRVLELLPPLVHVDSVVEDGNGGRLHDMVRMITHEAGSLRFGGEVMVTRLADILVIEVIRSWLASAPAQERGWIAALRDERLGRALAALHRAPEQAWDLQRLAKEARMSRSAFSARFTKLVGESAMQYLTRHRMALARAHLQHSRDPLAQTAQRFGYSTEAAFCKVFKRTFGVPPSAVRPTDARARPRAAPDATG